MSDLTSVIVFAAPSLEYFENTKYKTSIKYTNDAIVDYDILFSFYCNRDESLFPLL